MKRIITLGMMLMISLALAGCGSKDAEFKAFTTDFEQVTNDMIAKVDSNPTAEGVDEAQKVLDGKKADLKTKWNAIKDARGIQVSEETTKNFEAAIQRSSDKVTGVMTKITDAEAATKYQALIKDWGDIIGVGGK